MKVITQGRQQSANCEDFRFDYDRAKDLWVISRTSPLTGIAITVLGSYSDEKQCKSIFEEMLCRQNDEILKKHRYPMPPDKLDLKCF